jgi:protein-S-isoprenylcysteine O-methyltransferase Ste14
LLFLCERIYESYFTVKNGADEHLKQDRHLNRIIAAYCIMLLGAVLEFYLMRRQIDSAWTVIGFLLLIVSGYLRWSAIKVMGNDWAIDTFAVPANIQRQGIYRYIRHPYYVGVFLEAVSFPMILNSWYTLLFSVCVVAPLEGYRAFLEEKVLIQKYGWTYIRFKREVSRFLPTFIKRTAYDRRLRTDGNLLEKRNQKDRRSRDERSPFDADRRRIIRG